MTDMGSHLSGNIQAGRCRMRRGLPDDVISVVGHCPWRELGQEVGQVLLEAVVVHAGVPSGNGAGAEAGCSITDDRIEASA